MLLQTLISNIEILDLQGDVAREITGIAYDSRKVKTGYLFVAVPGFKTDGHHYIEQAIQAGAVAVVVEREISLAQPAVTVVRVVSCRRTLALLADVFYGHPSGRMTMIGVTGTNGKTTTASLIASIFQTKGSTGFIGTTANRIGTKKLPVSHTTPESAELQALLAEMVQDHVSTVAMEVSSHALSLERVTGVSYDVAVFTNLTRDHLDFHHTMEEYCQAKTKLFASLKPQEGRFAVINRDDPWQQHFQQASKVPVIGYGFKNPADIMASEVEITAKGVSFVILEKEQRVPLHLKLTGMFNVYNALAAYCVGRGRGLPPKQIVAALEEVDGIDGRFELVNQGQDFGVIVDYAHTPDGLENILQTAREITKGKLITVFGCGGDRDRLKRPMMGEIALNMSDHVIVTSDNPRTEDPLRIIDDIVQGMEEKKKKQTYLIEPDRRMAIEKAICMANPEDVVVIAGKGHEDYQIIGEAKHHFDDREEAAKALAKRSSPMHTMK